MRILCSVRELSLAVILATAGVAAVPALTSAKSVTYGIEAPKLDELRRLSDIAMQFYRAGQIQDAVGAFEAVARKAQEHFGAEHLHYASALNNLALLYDAAGELDRSETTYRQAIRIVEAKSDKPAKQLAYLQNNLAAVVLQKCRIADAHALYKRALVLSEQSFGPQNIDTRMVRDNVDRLDRYLGKTPQRETTFSLTGGETSDIGQLLQRCMS